HFYEKMRASKSEGPHGPGKPWKLPRFYGLVRTRHGVPIWVNITVNNHTLDCPLKKVSEVKRFGEQFEYRVTEDCQMLDEAKDDSVYSVLYKGNYYFYWKDTFTTYDTEPPGSGEAFRRLDVHWIKPDEHIDLMLRK